MKHKAELILSKIKNRLRRSPLPWLMMMWHGMLFFVQITVFRATINLLRLGRRKSSHPPTDSLRLLFVLPWFGENISGGAENNALHLIKDIGTLFGRIAVHCEVASTTLKEFASDWNAPFHLEGTHHEDGLIVHRFHPTSPNRVWFHDLNGRKLMSHDTANLWRGLNDPKSPVSRIIEYFYLKNMIISYRMFWFLAKNKYQYDFVIFLPYLFSTSILGSKIVGNKKSILIPCLHNEPYAFLNCVRSSLVGARQCIFNAKEEMFLARKLTNSRVKGDQWIGNRVNTNVPPGVESRFRSRFQVTGPFILYVGRKITGKNLPELVQWFEQWHKDHPDSDLKLVIIGRGDLDYSNRSLIYELGFVTDEEKNDAIRSAIALCQPSRNESFSLVIMESWLQEVPCIVDSRCDVTAGHCTESGGGFSVKSCAEFGQAVTTLLHDSDTRRTMGIRGKKYVLDHFSSMTVVHKFIAILKSLR